MPQQVLLENIWRISSHISGGTGQLIGRLEKDEIDVAMFVPLYCDRS
jgi:hypothetical protein